MKKKQSALLLVITIMVLWQLTHLKYDVRLSTDRISYAQVYELPQNHCSDNQEVTLFLLISWVHIFRRSCFCEIYALCGSRTTSDHLHVCLCLYCIYLYSFIFIYSSFFVKDKVFVSQ